VEVVAVELRRLELDLVRPLATSRGVHGRRPVVLVRLDTDLGVGWGECEALAAPTYTEEHADAAEAVLADHLVPMLLAAPHPFAGAADALGMLDAVRGHQMAKAAIEMALLDAELRAAGQSLAHRIGATRPTVVAGATVGDGPPAAAVREVAAALDDGIGHVKCKVASGRGIAHVREVRSSFPDLSMSVDANGSYRLEREADRAALQVLDGLALSAIEQPLAPDDLVGHAVLVSELETCVVLDESICTLGQLDTALALRACGGVSVKAARLGGVLAAVALRDRCAAAGVRLLAGGMLEAGLGRATALAVAALDGVDLPGDLGPSERYFSPDLTAPHVLRDGRIAVPDVPGIGATVRLDVVESLTVRTVTFPSRRTPDQRFVASRSPA